MKRHLVEFSLAMAGYAIVLALSLQLLAHGITPPVLRIAVSLAPMIPLLLLCAAILRGLRRLDEMQRKVQLEAFALAFAGTALLTFSYGFLENAGFPRLSMFTVWPLMAAFWILGVFIGRLRYR